MGCQWAIRRIQKPDNILSGLDLRIEEAGYAGYDG